MSETSTEEYTKKMRTRYARMTGRKARGKLLDEFIEITGWDRKHANKEGKSGTGSFLSGLIDWT